MNYDDEYGAYDDAGRCIECGNSDCECFRGGPRVIAYTLTAAAVAIALIVSLPFWC